MKRRHTQAYENKRRLYVRESIGKGLIKVIDIMNNTDYSRTEIENDIQYLKRDAQGWLNHQGIDGFTFQIRNAIERLELLLKEAWEDYKTLTDKNMRRLARLEIKELTQVVANVYSEGPVIYNLKQTIKKYEKENVTN